MRLSHTRRCCSPSDSSPSEWRVAGANRELERPCRTARSKFPLDDSQAQGQAIFHLGDDGQSLDYRLIATNIDNVVQSHIHVRSSPASNGPDRRLSYGPAAAGGRPSVWRPRNWHVQGRTTSSARLRVIRFEDLLVAMRSGNAYVNVAHGRRSLRRPTPAPGTSLAARSARNDSRRREALSRYGAAMCRPVQSARGRLVRDRHHRRSRPRRRAAVRRAARGSPLRLSGCARRRAAVGGAAGARGRGLDGPAAPRSSARRSARSPPRSSRGARCGAAPRAAEPRRSSAALPSSSPSSP